MGIFTEPAARVARAIGKLALGNPFLPERIDLEREALGDAFAAGQMVWSVDPTLVGHSPNVLALNTTAEALAQKARDELRRQSGVDPAERRLYEGLVLYVLYYRNEDALLREILAPVKSAGKLTLQNLYTSFRKDFTFFLELAGHGPLVTEPPEQLFALLFQHRRAFHFTFRQIFGGSLPAARLRAEVWQSIFTHDMERYREALFDRMHDLTTLITGPSGTGKELVAQAIGLSRYIPFDVARKAFIADFRESFQPLNLAALSPTLIESELFGHRRGAFTGAIADRQGFLDRPQPSATVFLDEIGELDLAIQLKLLRVLQTREFQRLGENQTRRFGGKIIAATNVDLQDEIGRGRFRADLYYRLCSDLITMPSLEEQIRAQPEELESLVTLLAGRLLGDTHGKAVAQQVLDVIDADLGPGYPWPGNMRELEQCVRNVLVRKHYRPQRAAQPAPAETDAKSLLAREMASGELTADELLSRYCTLIYAEAGSYEAAARRLHLDRRTVKSKVDPKLLRDLHREGRLP